MTMGGRKGGFVKSNLWHRPNDTSWTHTHRHRRRDHFSESPAGCPPLTAPICVRRTQSSGRGERFRYPNEVRDLAWNCVVRKKRKNKGQMWFCPPPHFPSFFVLFSFSFTAHKGLMFVSVCLAFVCGWILFTFVCGSVGLGFATSTHPCCSLMGWLSSADCLTAQGCSQQFLWSH